MKNKDRFLLGGFLPAMLAGFALSDNWQYILQKLAASVEKTRNRLSPNLGLLPFLVSAENEAAAQFDLSGAMELNQGNGKHYTIVRKFYPRQGEDQHAGQSLVFCNVAGDSTPYKEDTITVGYEHVSAPLILDDRMIRCLDDDRDTFLGDRMAEHLRTYLQSLARAVAKRVVSGGFVGRHMDGTTGAKDLPLLSENGAAINPVGEIQLLQDKRAAHLDDDFKMIGGTRLDVYRLARRIASANDLGFDASIAEQRDAVYYDSQVTAEMAAEFGVTDGALAIVPGALKFVSYNKFAGDFAYMSDKQERTTIVDPYLGLTHDVVYITEDCGEEVKRSIQFRTIFDVVGYPECWSADPCFDGITDVFAYNIVCQDASLCDITDQNCEVPAPAVSGVSGCTPGVDSCAPLVASFVSQCVTKTQYDYYTGLGALTAFDALIVDGVDYPFSQLYNVSIETEWNSMIAEINAILAENNYGEMVYENWGAINYGFTIFGNSPEAVISLAQGTENVPLDVNTGSFLEVQNTTTEPADLIIWNIGGDVRTGAPGGYIDPVEAEILGTFDRFYLSGAIITEITETTITAIVGSAAATFTDNIGPCN